MQPTQTLSSARTFTRSAISIIFVLVGHYNFTMLTVVITLPCSWQREGGRGGWREREERNTFSHLIMPSLAAEYWCKTFLDLPLTIMLNGVFFKLLKFLTSAFSFSLWSFWLALHTQFPPLSILSNLTMSTTFKTDSETLDSNFLQSFICGKHYS